MVNHCSSDTIPSSKFKTMLPFIYDSYSHFIVFVLDFHSPPPTMPFHSSQLLSNSAQHWHTFGVVHQEVNFSLLGILPIYFKKGSTTTRRIHPVIPCSYLVRPLQLRHVCSVSRQLRFIDRQNDETTVNLSPYCFLDFLWLVSTMASSTVVKSLTKLRLNTWNKMWMISFPFPHYEFSDELVATLWWNSCLKYLMCNGCAGPTRDLGDPGSVAGNSGQQFRLRHFSGATWEAQFPFQFKFQLYDELWIGSILKICRFLIRHIIPSRILPILNSAYFYRRNRQYSTRYDMPN